MRKLAGYFFRGVLVVVPLALTVYAVALSFTTLDQLLGLPIPGLGLLITLALITCVGFLTSNVIGKTLLEEFELLLGKVPLIKLIYASVKDLMHAFVGDKKRFDRPVAVALIAASQAKALGFITREDVSVLGLPGHVAVYFPQSYNFAGNVVLVPRELVETLDVSSADLMTFIVSGGISGFGPPVPEAPVQEDA